MARYTFKDFQADQGLEAVGAVVGDATALATSNSKYKGAQRGKTIGGGVGAAAGSIVGMPMVGQAVGSLIGGLIGGASDKKKMIEDYDEVAADRYSRLNLMPNINPYGNAASYADGGMTFAGGDPTDPKPKPVVRTLIPGQTTVQNEKQMNDVNEWTKNFEARHGGNPYFVTNAVQVRKVGDTLAPFVGDVPPEPVKRQTTLPPGITPNMVENTSEGYGYWHPQNGNFIPVDMQAIAPAKNTKSLPKNAIFLDDAVATNVTPKMKKGGIYIKPENRGKFNATKKRTGKSTEELTHSSNPVTRKRAIFAQNAAKWRKEDGGVINPESLISGAAGILGQIADTGETSGTIDMMMGNLPTMRKGGMSGAKFCEDGGMMPEKDLINIEKGEILIDPVTLDVLREYDNPNRYKPHQKDPMKEPVGNFTMIEKGKVIIPKKYADRYKNGDILTRKSIVGEILKNQLNNPEQNDPRMTTDAKFAQAGMVAGSGERKGKAMAFDWTNNVIQGVDQPRYPVARITDSAVDGLPQFSNTPQTTAPGYDDTPVDAMTASNEYDAQNPFKLPNTLQITSPAGTPTAVADSIVKNKLNKNLIASKVASFLPTAYGITNALGVDPYLRYDENTQMDNAKAYAASMETDPNIDASLNAIRRSSANRNRVLNNFNSPSTRAEIAANQGQLLNAEGEIIQRGQDISQQARNRKRETLMNLEAAQGAGRLDMRRQLMNELRMDKANRENMIHAGISEGVSNFQKGVMDEERIKAINTAAQFYQVDPYSASLLVDQHAFMPYVTDMMGKLSGTIPGVGRMEPTTEVGKVNRDRLGNIKSTTQITVKKPKKP